MRRNLQETFMTLEEVVARHLKKRGGGWVNLHSGDPRAISRVCFPRMCHKSASK